MEVFRVAILAVIVVALLAFRYRPELSRFEINRLAEHGAKYKRLAKFLDIYPGLLALTRVLALIAAILLTTFAALSWGIFAGGGLAFAAVLLSLLIARALGGVAQKLIDKQLAFFNKYFAWAGFLSKLTLAGDEPRLNSEHELAHLIREGDFLDDDTKNLLANALDWHNRTVREVMTPREHIAFVHSKDALTPVFIDELFNSGHKVFPVVQGGLDHVIGWLLLDDILPVDQREKILTESMRKCPPPIETTAPVEAALRQMCEYRATALMVERDGKVAGLITLSDIARALLKATE